MIARIECSGAPRDLGLDQGRACASNLRQRTRALGFQAVRRGGSGRWPSAGPARGPRAALARDGLRHFPHWAERTMGLARGGGVSVAALLACAEAVLAATNEQGEPRIALSDRGDPRLELALSDSRWDSSELVVRKAEPDGGYPTLALTPAWFAGSLAGLNQPGLGAAASILASPDDEDRWRASALLLLDQCLERFDTVEKAMEWCERRPGGGRSRLVFLDRSGAIGAVETEGEQRRRVDMKPGPIAEAPSPSLRARIDPREGTLELCFSDGSPERFAF